MTGGAGHLVRVRGTNRPRQGRGHPEAIVPARRPVGSELAIAVGEEPETVEDATSRSAQVGLIQRTPGTHRHRPRLPSSGVDKPGQPPPLRPHVLTAETSTTNCPIRHRPVTGRARESHAGDRRMSNRGAPRPLGPHDIVVVNDNRWCALPPPDQGRDWERAAAAPRPPENGNWRPCPPALAPRGTRLSGAPGGPTRVGSGRRDRRGGVEAEDAGGGVIDKAGEVPFPVHHPPRRPPATRPSTPHDALPPPRRSPRTESSWSGWSKTAGIAAPSCGSAWDRSAPTDRISDHRMHGDGCRSRETVDAIVRPWAAGWPSAPRRSGARDGCPRRAGPWTATPTSSSPRARFRAVDRLVTPLPRSSSSAIAAFMGPWWGEAYSVALQRGYRFLSFGDAMLCDREQP